MDDTTLIEALKAAGHEDQAKQLRDRQLAHQLRDAGHDTLADALEGNGSTAPADAEPAKPKTADQAQADAIVTALKRDTGIDLSRGEAA